MTADDGSNRGRHPWRDNIEAITMAIIMAVLLKYFVVEAYKIPTGSMQPTLYGSGPPHELYDRVLADKLSFRFRDPERFEVVIFRYPLDRSKNFVKRLVGLPGEQLKLENGDLWVRSDADTDWRIPIRPRLSLLVAVERGIPNRLDEVGLDHDQGHRADQSDQRESHRKRWPQ